MPECILVIKFADGIQNPNLTFTTIVMEYPLLIGENLRFAEKAAHAVEEIVSHGKQVLLVGTKRQAQEPIRELAAATNMPFCVNRWMGGTTNHETVSTSLAKYKKFLRRRMMAVWTSCWERKAQSGDKRHACTEISKVC